MVPVSRAHVKRIVNILRIIQNSKYINKNWPGICRKSFRSLHQHPQVSKIWIVLSLKSF